MFKTIISLLLMSSSAFAAGGAGGISDLVIPGLNFVVFVLILFFALRNPIKNMFKENASKVKELYSYAEEKDKEAQIKLDMYEKKMNGSEAEIKAFYEETKADGEKFKVDYKKEVEAQIEKMKVDAHAKIENEKNAMIRNLNASLVDEVIAKAKAKVNSDKEVKAKATKKLVSQI